jgi:hypothetical protein
MVDAFCFDVGCACLGGFADDACEGCGGGRYSGPERPVAMERRAGRIANGFGSSALATAADKGLAFCLEGAVEMDSVDASPCTLLGAAGGFAVIGGNGRGLSAWRV